MIEIISKRFVWDKINGVLDPRFISEIAFAILTPHDELLNLFYALLIRILDQPVPEKWKGIFKFKSSNANAKKQSA